jgi:hypothetical protein
MLLYKITIFPEWLQFESFLAERRASPAGREE